MTHTRTDMESTAFGGLDTIHICFGVSALRPLLGIAGVDPIRKIARAELLAGLPTPTSSVEVDVHGLRVVQEAHQRIDHVNVIATSMVLAAFVSAAVAARHATLRSADAGHHPLPTPT